MRAAKKKQLHTCPLCGALTRGRDVCLNSARCKERQKAAQAQPSAGDVLRGITRAPRTPTPLPRCQRVGTVNGLRQIAERMRVIAAELDRVDHTTSDTTTHAIDALEGLLRFATEASDR